MTATLCPRLRVIAAASRQTTGAADPCRRSEPALSKLPGFPQSPARSTGKAIPTRTKEAGNGSDRSRTPPQVEEVAGHLLGRRRGRLPDRVPRVLQARGRRRRLRLLRGGLDPGQRGGGTSSRPSIAWPIARVRAGCAAAPASPGRSADLNGVPEDPGAVSSASVHHPKPTGAGSTGRLRG